MSQDSQKKVDVSEMKIERTSKNDLTISLEWQLWTIFLTIFEKKWNYKIIFDGPAGEVILLKIFGIKFSHHRPDDNTVIIFLNARIGYIAKLYCGLTAINILVKKRPINSYENDDFPKKMVISPKNDDFPKKITDLNKKI